MDNTKIEKAVEEFEEFCSQGYSGGESGLRCSHCDTKYSGSSAIIQLCPVCKAKQALLTAYQQGKKDRDKEIVNRLDEILCNYSEDRPISPSIIRAFQETIIKPKL